MFPFYSKTQFRSIDSANRSREIYRENEVKLFAVFTFVGENERDRLMSAATFSSRARKIHDYTRFKNDRQFIFLLFCSVSRRLADFIAVITCKTVSSLRRIPHFGRDEIVQRAKTPRDFMDGTLERSSIFHLEAKRGAAHFLLLSIFLSSPC